MHRLLRAGILITFGLLIICIIGGCGDDSSEEVTDPSQSGNTDPVRREDDKEFPPTLKLVIYPVPGVHILPHTEFVLTFNEKVVAVTVNGTPATGSGYNWKWSAQPALPDGSVGLKIEWTNRDGSADSQVIGPYTVRGPDTTPPRITRWTVANGAVDVDPAPLNAGDFRFVFDEPITGAIRLTDEAGADLNWIATVAGKTATLTPVAGQELVHDTTYKIEIDVQDGNGNHTQVTITFVTKPK